MKTAAKTANPVSTQPSAAAERAATLIFRAHRCCNPEHSEDLTNVMAHAALIDREMESSPKVRAANRRIKQLETALQLHLDFLASLPKGWLGHTTGDIGLLNQAYIQSRKLGMKV
jgi:ubiquinone biosynthesis protein Coq4